MYTNYYKNADEEKFHAVETPIDDSWIHVEHATMSDLKHLSEVLDIEINDISDALDMMEIARIDRIEKEAFVVYVRFPYRQEVGLYTATLTIILTKKHIATISPTSVHILQRMLSQPSTLATKMRSKMLIEILHRIVQEYTRAIKRVRADVVNREQDIGSMSESEIMELTRKEEHLNQSLNSLLPLREVIEEILSGKFTVLYEKDQELLEDLLLATEQSEDLCRLSLRIISSLRNSVQVIITNQFNKTIKLLTALTIILNFPTTIASIYGMNVSLPFESSPWAFALIMGFIMLTSIAAFFFFQRRKWL